jgi:hypothetical protein
VNPNMSSLQYCRDVFGMTGNAADTSVKSDFRSKTDLDVGLFNPFWRSHV